MIKLNSFLNEKLILDSNEKKFQINLLLKLFLWIHDIHYMLSHWIKIMLWNWWTWIRMKGPRTEFNEFELKRNWGFASNSNFLILIIIANWLYKPLIFQTSNGIIPSLKYQRSTTSCSQEIWIRISKSVPQNHRFKSFL